jgi:hypothetical protein
MSFPLLSLSHPLIGEPESSIDLQWMIIHHPLQNYLPIKKLYNKILIGR